MGFAPVNQAAGAKSVETMAVANSVESAPGKATSVKMVNVSASRIATGRSAEPTAVVAAVGLAA